MTSKRAREVTAVCKLDTVREVVERWKAVEASALACTDVAFEDDYRSAAAAVTAAIRLVNELTEVLDG